MKEETSLTIGITSALSMGNSNRKKPKPPSDLYYYKFFLEGPGSRPSLTEVRLKEAINEVKLPLVNSRCDVMKAVVCGGTFTVFQTMTNELYVLENKSSYLGSFPLHYFGFQTNSSSGIVLLDKIRLKTLVKSVKSIHCSWECIALRMKNDVLNLRDGFQ